MEHNFTLVKLIWNWLSRDKYAINTFIVELNLLGTACWIKIVFLRKIKEMWRWKLRRYLLFDVIHLRITKNLNMIANVIQHNSEMNLILGSWCRVTRNRVRISYVLQTVISLIELFFNRFLGRCMVDSKILWILFDCWRQVVVYSDDNWFLLEINRVHDSYLKCTFFNFILQNNLVLLIPAKVYILSSTTFQNSTSICSFLVE